MLPKLPLDSENLQAWKEVAHRARISNRILNHVLEPSEGSTFDQVNALHEQEHASVWHHSFLDAALQHLVLWADIVSPLRFHPEQEGNFTYRPAYTLGRAALEAASQAAWMTADETAPEIVRRHASLVWWDYREHLKSLSDDAAKRPIRIQESELLDQFRRQFGGKYLSQLNHVVVLQGAAPMIDTKPAELIRVWRAASGAAHGRRWTSLALQTVVPMDEYQPGHHRAISYADPDGMTEILRLADRMVAHGVQRHATLSGADVPALRQEAFEWLAATVPR